jgi:VWFA-related protein
MRVVRLSACLFVFPALLAIPATGQGQKSVPDAPAPQASQTAPPNAPTPQSQPVTPLPDLRGQVAPGKGTTSADQQGAADAGQPAPQTSNGQVGQQQTQQPPPPDTGQAAPETGNASQEPVLTLHTGVTAVEVPVTVKDKHGKEIAGLPWWRFRVYEDGVRQNIAWFSTDAFPLSVAFVIDATLPSDIMAKVNRSLSVVSNGLTPADTVSVISYAGTGPQMITDFTAAQGPRLTAAMEMAKKPGEQPGVPITDGPFAAGPTVNGLQVDPTLAPQRGNASGVFMLPKEIHPLNDAILYAAEQLASQPRGRRRVVYVISDGRNSRSKASYKEVVQYLLAHNISVYGTNVGDSALWGIGYLDRTKLPFLQPEDVLPRYALATGGDVDHELSENGIQSAFVKITDSLRTAYTIVYYSHQPSISGKYHNIDVRVEGLTGLQVDAKQGYYPSASQE